MLDCDDAVLIGHARLVGQELVKSQQHVLANGVHEVDLTVESLLRLRHLVGIQRERSGRQGVLRSINLLEQVDIAQ